MTTVSYPKIEQLRSEFEDHQGSELAFEVLEECEGDVESAIDELAVREGLEIGWLDWDFLNEQCYSFICHTDVRRSLPGLADVLTTFVAQFYLPGLLAAALGVLIAVKVESDVEIYCNF